MAEASSRHGFATEAARQVAGGDVALLVGRVLIAAIYLNGGFHKLVGLEGFAEYLASQGIAVGAYPLAVLAACVEFFGALCVLAGWGTRCAALLMALFTVVAALLAHRYWSFADPAQARAQMINFDKNLAMVGGFLILYAAGPGRWSVDRRGG